MPEAQCWPLAVAVRVAAFQLTNQQANRRPEEGEEEVERQQHEGDALIM